MALTGLDIYKKLPKENCKECGVPTCLAFAMKVAAGQAGLESCPRLSAEAQAELGEASAPPQRLIRIGADHKAIELGQETVLFRHDERFHHPTAVALKVSDTYDEAQLQKVCTDFKSLQFLRIGETIHPDMIALVNESGSADTMQSSAETIYNELGVPMVLMSEKIEPLSAVAMGPLSGAKPLLYCTGEVTTDDLAKLAKQTGAPLCVAGDLESVAEQVEALGKDAVKDIMISPGSTPTVESIDFLTRTRRAALNKKFRALGCPVLVLANGEDKIAAALDACTYVCKYAAIVVTDVWEPASLLPVLTSRQNIYTDPQKPVQVEPKLYEIGDVTPTSPLLVTTNFSLSYYSVESEVEAAREPCRILAVDTEGTSVLTAWAADKFNPETITEALKATGALDKAEHDKVVIPGHVAVIAAQLAEESGAKVLVGPKEASGIGPYLKNDWKVA